METVLLSVRKVALLLDMSENAVRKAEQRGLLRRVGGLGKRVRFRLKDVRTLAEGSA